MAPMVHGLEAQYFGKIDFFYLDADDPATREYQQKFGFQYQPYFILLDGNGKEVKRWAGAVGKDEFEAAFSNTLK
jgi:thioredoxin-related protein